MDILLVDDETAFAGLLADRLRLRGYTVRCAPNAETALRLIGEKAPDVAFLDVGLPGMDGIGLLEKIRLMPAPVICCMLTGAAQEEVAQAAQELAERLAQADEDEIATILGPTALPKFRGEYRYQIIVKAAEEEPLRQLVLPTAERMKKERSRNVRVGLALNPTNIV